MSTSSQDRKKIYIDMLRIRLAEQTIAQFYYDNKIKTPVHLANGAEAIPAYLLNQIQDTRVYSTYRSHHWYLMRTQDYESFFAELLGKEAAPCKGRAGSMHLSYPAKGFIMSSAIVASTLPIAVGDAWAGKQKNSNERVVCAFGDGAIEEGVFFESLNFASLKKIPILFVCEDNDLAIHSFKKNRQAFDIESVVTSLKIPYLFAQGYDIDDMQSVMPQLKEKLKSGPVFLRANYVRLLEHVGTGTDFQFNYREKPENPQICDPVLNLKNKLISEGLSEDELNQIHKIESTRMEEIYRKCLELPDAKVSGVYQHLYEGGN